jgi:hypothetical protein
MKRFLLALAVMMTIGNIPAFAADVGVSISIGQPGFYGRIDLGNAPQPEYYNPRPIIIQPVPRGRTVEPIYLRVPPGHQKNWSKYCGRYNACGQPVHFVKDQWYNDVYAPHYNKQHGHGDKRDGNRGREDESRGRGNDDRGNDRGHGRGQDKGHGRN